MSVLFCVFSVSLFNRCLFGVLVNHICCICHFLLFLFYLKQKKSYNFPFLFVDKFCWFSYVLVDLCWFLNVAGYNCLVMGYYSKNFATKFVLVKGYVSKMNWKAFHHWSGIIWITQEDLFFSHQIQLDCKIIYPSNADLWQFFKLWWLLEMCVFLLPESILRICILLENHFPLNFLINCHSIVHTIFFSLIFLISL